MLEKENIDCNSIYFKNRLLRAKNWLKEYKNERISLLEEFNEKYYETLNDVEKSWLCDTLDILQNDFATTEDLQAELYSIVKKQTSDSKEIKILQKRYFKILYN